MKFTGKVLGAAVALAAAAAIVPSTADAAIISSVTSAKNLNTTKTYSYTIPTSIKAGSKLYLYLRSTDSGGKSLTNVNFTAASLSASHIVKQVVTKVVNGKTVKTTVNVTVYDYPKTALTTIKQGTTELRELLYIPVTAGEKFTLSVTSTAQKLGYYTVEWVVAVPEVATWALMVMGFGAVAYSMRRRVAQTGRLAIA